MNGFQIHKDAVQIEHYLNKALRNAFGYGAQQIEDISEIYDGPIRICMEVFHKLEDEGKGTKPMYTLKQIQRKYQTYYGYILSQFDESTLRSLCEDLKQICSAK